MLRFLLEASDEEFGEEGTDWVRPGSVLSPGMKSGATNMPYGHGYPNYKRKRDDQEDYDEIVDINYIKDTPYDHSHADDKNRTGKLYRFVKTKMPEFYEKFKDYIDSLFSRYDTYEDIHHWLIGMLFLAKEQPNHQNVSDKLKGIEITDTDIESAHKISDVYYKLYSILHHREDPQNENNYPLYVSLYDITRRLGGYEEGGWYYDHYELKDSIQINSPSQLNDAAEKLYIKIKGFDGKPKICVEKNKGSQIKDRPHYS